MAAGFGRSAQNRWQRFYSPRNLRIVRTVSVFIMRYPVACLLALIFAVARAPAAPTAEPPREWIDPDTGHRVIRLSDEPGTASLYFHQNAYSPDGKKLVVTTPHGISTITLATRAIDEVVSGKVNVIVVGRQSGDVYYSRRQDDGVWI